VSSAKTLDAVVDDTEETVVQRSGHEPVVIVLPAEYESMKESADLSSDPVNAAFLRAGIADMDAGINLTVQDPENHPLLTEKGTGAA
jgi:PHD/YefM family antitoxin component YafN of YafNO toxin-antitoxin module